jgi:hypothetical protein
MIHARAVVLSLILAITLSGPIQAQQSGPHRAGLVVVYSDGSIAHACIDFAEESITGAELLRRSGLEVIFDAYGGLGYGVCAISDEGCGTGQDCFCQCRGNPCAYWVYSHRRPNGSWAISGTGASGWQVHDGDVDGWVWGDGSTAPPVVTFEQVCPSDETEPDLSPAARSSASPTPTSAPLPSPAASINQNAPLITAAPTPPTPARGRGSNPLGYAIFGSVAVGLLSWLILSSIRGRHT